MGLSRSYCNGLNYCNDIITSTLGHRFPHRKRWKFFNILDALAYALRYVARVQFTIETVCNVHEVFYLRKYYEITISHARTAQTIIYELQLDVFGITTTGERFSLLCSGHAGRRVRITGGVYTIRIPPGCRVSNVGFSITGVVHRNSQITISPPTITITPFRLVTTVIRESVAAHLDGPNWVALGRVDNIKLSSLDDDPLGSS